MLNSSRRAILRSIAKSSNRHALPAAKRNISLSPILREKSQVLNELEARAGDAHVRPSEAEIKKAAAHPVPDIDVSALTIKENTNKKTPPPNADLQFGHTFTDHMLLIPWNAEKGWSAPSIVPYGPLALDPSSTVFHYAPCLFEGLKAYVDKAGTPRLFRPDKNMARMKHSASRLAFPDFDGEAVIELIKKLVNMDKHWIPSEPGHSLYIRPTMIGTQAALGIGASSDVLLFVIASPVGPYYKTGFKPVSLLATTQYVRAFPGGTGAYKLGSNYAAGVVPQIQAAAQGHQQILWLFGPEHYLTEVGTMNLFVVLENEAGVTQLITPPLEDMVLPGVTRDSILDLAHEHASGRMRLPGLPDKLEVIERKMTMPEVVAAQKQGQLKEMFGSGTAAVVSPINNLGYMGENIAVPVAEDGLGDIARVMLNELAARQYGEIESPWSWKVE